MTELALMHSVASCRASDEIAIVEGLRSHMAACGLNPVANSSDIGTVSRLLRSTRNGLSGRKEIVLLGSTMIYDPERAIFSATNGSDLLFALELAANDSQPDLTSLRLEAIKSFHQGRWTLIEATVSHGMLSISYMARTSTGIDRREWHRSIRDVKRLGPDIVRRQIQNLAATNPAPS